MNIKDVKQFEIKGDRLTAMFRRQQFLMDKYKEIENLPDAPLDLNIKRDQAIIKDFAWRATEEVGEALECLEKNDENDINWDHLNEELSDALHFMIENCIFAGIEPKDLILPHPGFVAIEGDLFRHLYIISEFTLLAIEHDCGEDSINFLLMTGIFVKELSKAMNCLKNKPWKKSQILTDEVKFKNKMIAAFTSLIMIFIVAGLDDNQICDVYFKKSVVNQFRQESNY